MAVLQHPLFLTLGLPGSNDFRFEDGLNRRYSSERRSFLRQRRHVQAAVYPVTAGAKGRKALPRIKSGGDVPSREHVFYGRFRSRERVQATSPGVRRLKQAGREAAQPEPRKESGQAGPKGHHHADRSLESNDFSDLWLGDSDLVGAYIRRWYTNTMTKLTPKDAPFLRDRR